jgi:hypothetical protein
MTPEEADEEFYGGMWGNALISVWFFDGKAKSGKTYPKRVLGSLHSVQKVKDDEAFGQGRIDDEGVFDEVDDDDTQDGMDDEL